MGSKTNIPASDLISEARSQSVTRLKSSTSQVRGRERGVGDKIIIYYLCQAGIIWLTEYEGGRLLGNVSPLQLSAALATLHL